MEQKRKKKEREGPYRLSSPAHACTLALQKNNHRSCSQGRDLLPDSTGESLPLSRCRSWCQRGLIPTFRSARSCACWVSHRTWRFEAPPATQRFHQQAPGRRRGKKKVLISCLTFQSIQSKNSSSKPEPNSRPTHPWQQRLKLFDSGRFEKCKCGLHRNPEYNSVTQSLKL